MKKAMKPENTHQVSSMRSKLWDQLSRWEGKYRLEEFPKISIVIPTENAASLITLTLDSVLSQTYPSFEVIIVDNSTDRTVEIVKNYHDERVTIYSMSKGNRYEMLNKGVAQAQGDYINFLFPGDFYIYRDALKYMMTLALDHNTPNLVYCGALLRDASADGKILFRELTLDLLKRGQQPTSLQSCWFLTDTLRELKKFNIHYQMRGGFDLLCRFYLQSGYRHVSTSRVLTDYDLRVVRRRMVMIHFWETMKVVYRYFGFSGVMRWLVHQKDTKRLFKLWVRSLKIAFSGK